MNYHLSTAQTSLGERVAKDDAVAIVGLACRFPAGDGPAQLWRSLCAGVEAVREVPADRWDASSHQSPDRGATGKMVSARGGFLDRVDGFDPEFFAISPREALQMDPQQRLALELAWEALEHAGVPPHTLHDSETGVYLGAMWTDYEKLHGLDHIEQHSGTGWQLGVVPGRISHVLGLRGPSLAVNTACSSSLVAVHLACQALLTGDASLALAGGVSLMLTPHMGVAMSKFGGTSASGRCRAYDAGADGYVRGEGGGVVVLRRLSDAIAAGDRILACILGSAVNNDGASPGLTVPSDVAQQRLLVDAYARAGVDPRAVTFVDGHGSGTAVGDPIEARALGRVLGLGRPPDRPLLLGSVKPNIGHAEAASGVASLIKTVLALDARLIPPTCNFERPNPAIDFEALALRVPTELTPWPGPALAGVSAFGIGGTNCHLVLGGVEARPGPSPSPSPTPEPHLFVVSGHRPEALAARLEQLGELARAGELELADLAHTLMHRRTLLEHRAAVVARSHAELAERIARGELQRARRVASAARVAYVFSGQGSQWAAMGAGLLAGGDEVFRAALQRCDAQLSPQLGWSIVAAIEAGELGERLAQIDAIQPLIFAFQIALAARWRALGVVPQAVVGHSMGEVAAAVVAGALSLEDGARVICTRARLLRRIAGRGGMISVGLSAEATARRIADEPGLHVAVHSGLHSTVVSGELDGLPRLQARLEAEQIEWREIKVDVAAHSPQIDALAPILVEAIGPLRHQPPAIPVFSTLSAEAQTFDVSYWVRNLREPVRFVDASRRLLEAGFDTFVEISPHPLLTQSIAELADALGLRPTIVASLRRDRDERESMLEAIAALRCRGLEFETIEAAGRLVDLPAYPWQRRRFWPEAAAPAAAPAPAPGVELQASFDPRRVPELGAHHVAGRSVVSAGVALQLVVRAARLSASAELVVLEAVELDEAMAGDRALTLSLGPGDFCLSSAGQACVRGRVRRGGDPSAPTPPRLHEVRATTALGDELWARLDAVGVSYGDALRTIVELHRGLDERGRAVVELVVDAQASTLARLDAAFQALAVAAELDAPALVTRLASLVVVAELGELRSIRARVVDGQGQAWLLDRDERVLAWLDGAELRALAPAPSPLRLREWIEVAQVTAPRLASPRRWLVLDGEADARAANDALEAAMSGAGEELLRCAEQPSPEQLAGAHALLVVHRGRPDAGLDETVAACSQLRRALQISSAAAPPLPVVVITEGGELVEAPRPSAAAVLALARVAAAELPALELRTVDLADLDDPVEAAALVHELSAGSGRAVLRAREGLCRRFIPSLRPYRPPAPAAAERVSAPRGTLAITGGLGGLGRAVAAWLVERGASRLALLSRRSPDAEALAFIHELRSRGAAVDHHAVDVADREALARWLGALDEPLGGVVHCAAVLADAPTLDLDPASLRAVLEPKLEGARNLDALTRDHALGLFLCFSSIGGWIGVPGQGAYAAANAYLDALMTRRREAGRAGLSVGWCAWRGVGFAATAGGREAIERLALDGVGSIELDEGLALLEQLLRGEPPAAAIAVMPTIAEADAAPAHSELVAGLRALEPASRRVAGLCDHILSEVAAVLRQDEQRVDPTRPLRELGLDSMMAVELVARLRRTLAIDATSTLIWQHPTIERLTAHFVEALELDADPPAAAATTGLRRDADPAAGLDADPAAGLDAAALLAELELSEDELAALSEAEVEALLGVL